MQKSKYYFQPSKSGCCLVLTKKGEKESYPVEYLPELHGTPRLCSLSSSL